jgi:hypothetical protein
MAPVRPGRAETQKQISKAFKTVGGQQSPRFFCFLPTKGSFKNNFTFYTPMHFLQLRCESSGYPDIPAISRLAARAPQRLKL